MMILSTILKLNPIRFSVSLLACGLVFCVTNVSAQRNDHLTSEEIELIRFHQKIDKRIEVYVKAIERRFLAINGTGSLTPKEHKRLLKDAEKWGELPKGSQTKSISDIEKIIDEAINKIDDVASRDPKSNLFKKAVHLLAENARAFIPRLNLLNEKAQNSRERALISSAISDCNDIIEASAKVSKPTKKAKKKKKRT